MPIFKRTDEPETLAPVVALTANDLATIRRESSPEQAGSVMDPTGRVIRQGEPQVVSFVCTVCNNRTPYTEQHTCTGLSPRQLRRMKQQQAQNAAALARLNTPTPCQDCGAQGAHLCTGPVDAASAAARDHQLAGLVASLKAAGLKVVSSDE
jgi:hypothetical protein